MEGYHESEQLLGSWLHQDWPLESESWEVAIERGVGGLSAADHEAVIGQVDRLLASIGDDDELAEFVLTHLGCYYDPGSTGQTMREWLASVRAAVLADLVE